MASQSNQELFDGFDPIAYLKRATSGQCENSTKFLSDWLFRTFSKGYITGETLLDLGTGPNMNPVICASPYFNKIYLSDYSRNNRQFLEEWRQGNHRDITRYFFEEAVKREGNTQTPIERETEFLAKIEDIFYCDVTQENPLGGNRQSATQQFDVITTCWCVNNAATTLPQYKQFLNNVLSLIKPGGYLVLLGISNTTGDYQVNNVSYPSANFTMEEAKSLFCSPRMKIMDWIWADDVIDIGALYNVVVKVG